MMFCILDSNGILYFILNICIESLVMMIMVEVFDDCICVIVIKCEELLFVIVFIEYVKVVLGWIKFDIVVFKGLWYDVDVFYSDFIVCFIDEKKEYKELSESYMKKLFGGLKY